MAISALNPHAPIFVPSAYRAVEDFSDQWWDLVQSCPWFRDYWLRECFSDPQLDLSPFLDDNDDDDCFLDDSLTYKEGKGSRSDSVALWWLKWRKPRGESEMPRYSEKAPKIVNMKVKPRAIQQPR